MKMRDDFCIFILTHGRPDKVLTYNSLIRNGYDGKIYIVIDNEDKKADEYKAKFKGQVLQFDKSKLASETDEGDNFAHRKAIVYARNACWELAEQVGCRYFCQLDDDYPSWQLRFNSKLDYVSGCMKKHITEMFNELLEFYIKSNATSIAISQGGDHMGGAGPDNGQHKLKLSRKCMNSWFCDTTKPFRFFGHMNEDVSAYVTYGHRGHLFLTVHHAMLVQMPTQVTAGGMSDLYLSAGTYQKSFYTVMAAPSCVQIGTMGDPRTDAARIHHKINWERAVPKILEEKWKK